MGASTAVVPYAGSGRWEGARHEHGFEGARVTDQSFIPERDRELLVVFPDREAAGAARQRLLELGVPEADIAVDEESDEVASLRAEMRQELTDAWVVPNAAFVATKEGVKGMLGVGALAAAIGALLAIPFAFVDFGGTFWFRLALFVGLGIVAGATVGLVAGPGMASKRPGELMAAHRGIVVRVRQDTPEIRSALVASKVIRLDEVAHDDTPIETLVTEEQVEGTGSAQQVAENLEAGDDYHPGDPAKSADGAGTS